MHSIPEAARILGLAPATLRAQARNKKLHAIKVSRDWYVTSEELERYRRENRRVEGRKVLVEAVNMPEATA